MGEPNDELIEESCTVLRRTSKRYESVICTIPTCFPCHVKKKTVFKLKGLCQEQEKIDTDYIFLRDAVSEGKMIFLGLLGKTFIILNEGTKNWELTSQNATEGILGTFDDSKSFPLGMHSWSLNVQCEDPVKTPVAMQLKLTKVIFEKFKPVPFCSLLIFNHMQYMLSLVSWPQ